MGENPRSACLTLIVVTALSSRLLSPSDMNTEDPLAQFSHLVKEFASRFPDLAYLHLVEPRVQGFELVDHKRDETNDFFRKLWPGPLITAGGYTRSLAIETADKNGRELIAFGRPFIANVGFRHPIEVILY